MHVKASRNQISCNEHVDLAFAELFYASVSLIILEISEQDVAPVSIVIELGIYFISEVFGIDEYDGLGVLFESFEELLDEIYLSAEGALLIELLHVIKLDILHLHHNLAGIRDNLSYLVTYCLLKGC